MHEDEEKAIALHLYCCLFVRQGPWFALDDLYGRYYVIVMGGGSAAVGQTSERRPTRMMREGPIHCVDALPI